MKNERFFVKPVGHVGQFVLTVGDLRQDGSMRELPGGYQSPKFRSYNEALLLLFGAMDLRVVAQNMQQQNTPLMERVSILEKLFVLRRALREHMLPEATPAAGQIMIAQCMGTCSPDEAEQALAFLA